MTLRKVYDPAFSHGTLPGCHAASCRGVFFFPYPSFIKGSLLYSPSALFARQGYMWPLTRKKGPGVGTGQPLWLNCSSWRRAVCHSSPRMESCRTFTDCASQWDSLLLLMMIAQREGSTEASRHCKI